MREKFAACKALGGDVSEHMRAYLADIHSLDEDIGRLLKRLDELGLSDKHYRCLFKRSRFGTRSRRRQKA